MIERLTEIPREDTMKGYFLGLLTEEILMAYQYVSSRGLDDVLIIVIIVTVVVRSRKS